MTLALFDTMTLFDIDGTLLRSGGVGRESMVAAAAALFARPDAFDGVSFAGAIDPIILRDALAQVDIATDPTLVSAFRGRYLKELRRKMAQAVADGRAALCPGVIPAINVSRSFGPVGLLTGNWRKGAQIKLEALGLWARFAGGVGAFGEDGSHRDALPHVAWRRASTRGHKLRRIVIIGDTPCDVQCARAGRATLLARRIDVFAVAVNTGFATRDALVASAPDLLLEDLASGLPELVEFLGA